ncbi:MULTISPECIES: FecR family protein [Niastella]|uniref:DUF4974 domain-containing protein n=1 Tax=Niastella soli TaxID=2821487 RepID=A0ABS3YZ23_9BACT|nr:FecR family protein [Niastella soli]MBO9202406.1 DUF4974 domain-containing protein [Niastella soli]
MEAQNNKIASLIIKYRKTTLNNKEQEELNAWRSLSEENETLFQSLTDAPYLSELKVDLRADWKKVKQLYKAETGRPYPMGRSKFLSIAASIVVLLTAGIIWLSLPSSRNEPVLSKIEPPKQRNTPLIVKNSPQLPTEVTLTFSNGSTCQPDKMDNGSHIDYKSSRVVKVSNKKLKIIPLPVKINTPSGELNEAFHTPSNELNETFNTPGSELNEVTDIALNTLQIPSGRTYELELSDGSTVLLNAASTFRFPTVFSPTHRNVELIGEAFFNVRQVTLDGTNKIPFTVSALGTIVNVLGTQFNLNAYDDETITTTLITGEIDLIHEGSTTHIQPGQKAVLNNGHFSIRENVNIAEEIAWKKNLFEFRDTPLRNIMQQLTHWYDVEFVFNCCDSTSYTTTASRGEPLPEFLENMEETGDVHFEINGRRILVTSK